MQPVSNLLQRSMSVKIAYLMEWERGWRVEITPTRWGRWLRCYAVRTSTKKTLPEQFHQLIQHPVPEGLVTRGVPLPRGKLTKTLQHCEWGNCEVFGRYVQIPLEISSFSGQWSLHWLVMQCLHQLQNGARVSNKVCVCLCIPFSLPRSLPPSCMLWW